MFLCVVCTLRTISSVTQHNTTILLDEGHIRSFKDTKSDSASIAYCHRQHVPGPVAQNQVTLARYVQSVACYLQSGSGKRLPKHLFFEFYIAMLFF